MKSESTLRLKLPALCLGLVLGGCASAGRPAFLAPDQLVPPRPGISASVELEPGDVASMQELAAERADVATGAEPRDLVALVDLALARNPASRRAWEQARAAAARVGRAESAYFPEAGFGVEAGYQKFWFQGSSPVLVEQWEVQPRVSLTWTLLDFGRRGNALDAARQRLRVANLLSNREIQDIVFAVEKAYFALDAAYAMVSAAEQNLARAISVADAAEDRRELGLATRPDALLARQARAKAVYDVESARVLVSDAQAELAMALGVEANRPIEIRRLADLPLPESLDGDVDSFIDSALEKRPDLLARLAEVRAQEAIAREARARLLPEVYVDGGWGQDIWWYRFNGPPTDDLNEPQYTGLLGFRWSLFEGFDRTNAIREADAEREAARAALESARLDTIATVWRVYHDFRAARKKWEYAEALVAASTEAWESNQESYGLGLVTIVELLTAERDLAEALYVQIDARADLLTTAAEMVWVVGDVSASSDRTSRPDPAERSPLDVD